MHFHAFVNTFILYPIYLGPYEVIRQVKNDVEVRDLVRGNIKVFHVERLKIFHGSKEEAFRLAKIDTDHHPKINNYLDIVNGSSEIMQLNS
jgi:hypothetical protein